MPSSILSALLLAPAAAQAPCIWLHLAGAETTAVGVLFARGFDHDPKGRSGLASVLAAARLEQGRRAAGELLASGMQVGGDHVIVFAVVHQDQVDRAAAFVDAARGDGAGLDDDALALAIARAALAADDSEFLYPGDVLMTRARRRLGSGNALARPPAGVATECIALTPAEVRRQLAVEVPVRVAALGHVDRDWIEAFEALRWPAAPPPADGAARASPPVRRGMTEDVSSRADSPYVAVAFAAPPAGERAAFALGMEVARARAFGRFRLRGRELFARAPFVRWSWLHADPIVMFYRRGEDHVQLLPGERPDANIRDEVQATRRELEGLLDDLRALPPSRDELRAARTALRLRLALPGPGEQVPWASEPATLPGRLQVMLLREHHAVDVEKLDGITEDEVHASLIETLAADRASWHAMLPRNREGLGYRAR